MSKTIKQFSLNVNKLMRSFTKKSLLAVLGLMLTIGTAGTVVAQVIEPIAEDETQEQSYDKSFVCSAYYSPLPGQNRYATGTYAGDIRLNGNGVHGASGMAVFPGMVAAPPNYPFGTKMFIPGIGMTTVADRGGAIKGNRLDIWFGYGDEALVRALQFGKRPCLVTVYGLNPGLTNSVQFNQETVAAKPVADPFKFKEELNVGSEGESVKRLQQFLKDMGYFKAPVDGKYGETTKNAVLEFQKAQGLLENPSVEVPGAFGSTTIGHMELLLASGREKYLDKVPSRNMGMGATGEEVKRLQEALRLLGYDIDVSGIYDRDTVEAVFSFQLKEKIVFNSSDNGAGYFGPQTQLKLDQLMNGLDSNEVFTPQSIETEDVAVTKEAAPQVGFINLKEGDSGDKVVELQSSLKDLNYLRVEPTGYYGPLTTHAVFKLQQKLKLVSSKDEADAGVVTAKTAKALADYQTEKEQLVATIKKSTNPIQLLAQSRDLKKGMRGGDVKELQEFLKKKGYFPGAYTTEYFGDVTEAALIEFKIDFGLIKSHEEDNAGDFNQSTKTILAQLI